MAVTKRMLFEHAQDFLLASWEDGELVMEPYCHCGNQLGEDYFCTACNRECDCTFIAATSPQALAVAEKLISGNPNFKTYNASLLDE
ncbi:MAG: hypothetical protein ACLGPL_01690 [Acidobacteriota bacterium]